MLVSSIGTALLPTALKSMAPAITQPFPNLIPNGHVGKEMNSSCFPLRAREESGALYVGMADIVRTEVQRVQRGRAPYACSNDDLSSDVSDALFFHLPSS